MPPLNVGDNVKLKLDDEKGWKTSAQVVAKDEENVRSYTVQTPTATLRRNMRHLRPAPERSFYERVTYDDKEPTNPQSQARKDSTETSGETRTSSGRAIRKPRRYIEDY